jgi:hypothetical protein
MMDFLQEPVGEQIPQLHLSDHADAPSPGRQNLGDDACGGLEKSSAPAAALLAQFPVWTGDMVLAGELLEAF